MVPTFFDQNMPRNLGFYDRKMNWTFLLIFSSSSLKNWTKFSSSSFSKKVNWVQFKVHQKSELLNWTELFRSVQSLPCLYHYLLLPPPHSWWTQSKAFQGLCHPIVIWSAEVRVLFEENRTDILWQDYYLYPKLGSMDLPNKTQPPL